MPKSETDEQHAHRIFKSYKVGLKKEEDLTNLELVLLRIYYPFLFTDHQKRLFDIWIEKK